MPGGQGAYKSILERVFFSRYSSGQTQVSFSVDDIIDSAVALELDRPRNIPDLIYNAVYRGGLPESVTALAAGGLEWTVRIKGDGKYEFVLEQPLDLKPNATMLATKVPDSTPGIISMYALNDEQALLAKLRYNRLVDLFVGLACYSLQSHLRTRAGGAQVETDEVYVGLDRNGAHYVIPVQAKGGSDRLHRVQIEQDMTMCAEKFPDARCRPVAAQFMRGDVIALFELAKDAGQVKVAREKHYLLVPPDQLTPEELRQYSSQGNG